MTNKKGRSPNKKVRSPNKKGRSPNKKGRSPNKKEKIQNKKIDYTKYHSTSGLSTKSWGPKGWYFLFSCIMGGYPIKIDKNNDDHVRIKRQFKNMLLSLGYTMPCIYCRESFKKFCKELPIESSLSGRIELMRWLYDLRNKVNEKLIAQEKKCYNDEKKRLKKIYYSGLKTNESQENYYDSLKQFKEKTFVTKQSPSFQEVLDAYESIRAVCSNKSKTCALQVEAN